MHNEVCDDEKTANSHKRVDAEVAFGPVAILLIAGSALAMSSTNYRLDWFTPLTSGGGGPASSAHYAVNLTVGQSAIGTSDGTDYNACLGYWCGTAVEHRIFLPLVLRNFS